MNYITNLDFYKELNSLDFNINYNNACMLSGEKLSDNFITLECNHKFNYLPLYTEICQQKKINSIH